MRTRFLNLRIPAGGNQTAPSELIVENGRIVGLPSIGLETAAEDLHIEVQRVDHPSRVHLDIETDDIEAEVARLEALGARRVSDIRRWVVMEAPTGQRFCVIPAARANFAQRAHRWD